MTSYESLVDWLSANGFRQSRSADRWGHEVWARKGVSVTLRANVSAGEAEALRLRCESDMSLAGRKPKTARARATAAKKVAANERRRLELESLIALKNRELGGLRAVLSGPEARAIIQKIEKWERELRAMNALMTAIPGPRADANRPRAKHRS